MSLPDIYDLFTKRKPPPGPHLVPFAPRTGEGGTRYANTALDREATAVATTPEGHRNHQLNKSAFNLSQLIVAGHLPAQTVWDTLTNAATSAGLHHDEIEATLKSGYQGGTTNPRNNVPNPNDDTDSSWLPPVTTIKDPPPPDNNTTTNPAPTDDHDDITTLVHNHLPIINWHELWADDEEEEWILEPLLPARRLVALYSPPKIGKSLLMLEVAAAIAQGTEVLGTQVPRPHRVLYVDFENDPRTDIRSRLQAMGHTPDQLDNLCYLSFPTLSGLDSERGSAELLAAIQVYECEVVVIDTVSRSVAGEENENDTWLDFYRHTGLKMKQAGVSMIRLDHTGKDETKGQRGGSAKSGDVDAVWRLARVTETMFQLTCEEARLPIAEKVIVMEREPLPHLHHHVQASGRKAAWDGKIREVLKVLDAAGAPREIGRTKARDLIKTTGISASNAVLDEALRQRKNTPHVLPSPQEELP